MDIANLSVAMSGQAGYTRKKAVLVDEGGKVRTASDNGHTHHHALVNAVNLFNTPDGCILVQMEIEE